MAQGFDFLITVDWEGLSLSSKNLERLQRFKKRWAIPLVHYMNPAYFTHPDLNRSAQELIWPEIIGFDDELGLHLHASRHFVESAGVEFRSYPCFSSSGEDYQQEWAGQEVMLLAYSSSEFDQLVEKSLEVFEKQNFKRPKSFRAGGWMMSPDFYPVLSQRRFTTDSSSVPVAHLKGTSWEGDNLHRYHKLLWSDVLDSSQPKWLEESLLQVPNNLGAIDYWKDIEAITEKVLLSDEGMKFVITLHQETADEHLDQLDLLFTSLLEAGRQLNFKTTQQVYDEIEPSASTSQEKENSVILNG